MLRIGARTMIYIDIANETSAAFSSNKCPSREQLASIYKETLVIDDSNSAVFEKTSG